MYPQHDRFAWLEVLKGFGTRRLIDNHSDIQATIGLFPTDCALQVDFNTYAVSSSIIFDLYLVA